MPNCFQFISKASGQAESFGDIDNLLCAHLGVEPHPQDYYRGWYDAFGQGVASGKTFENLIDLYRDDEDGDEEVLVMLEWLNARYTTKSWYEYKV